MRASPFPSAGGAAAGAAGPGARSPTISASSSSFLRDIADATSQHYGSPNQLPGPPPSHFFPSVPRAQRDKARQARLASASPPPSHPQLPPTGLAALAAAAAPLQYASASAGAHAHHSSSPEAEEHDQEVLAERQRQAKVELASAGPFDNRRPSAVSLASARSTGSGGPFPSVVKSVGTGGSGGTKRRHRDLDRTSWDAASELVRLEREKERAIFGGPAGKGKGKAQADEDKEKTPTPSMTAVFPGSRPVAAKGKEDAAMAVDDDEEEDELEDRPPPVPSKSLSPELDDGRAPSFISAETGGEEDDDGEGEGDDVMMDDASMRSGLSGTSKATGADESGKEPAKKRSRTLTTPAQTAVLNALLAKTRFPSTETREEVGKQIGMSARRVQIWFQNRRQSQKRQRDREAQEAAAAAAAGHVLSHHHLAQQHHQHQQPVYQHPYAPHAHIDPYSSQGAHFYPPLQPKPHDPYAQQHPQQPHLQAPSRPDLHHRVSADSIASRASFASVAQSQHSGVSSMHALSTQGSERDGLGPLPSEARLGHPYAPSSAYANSPYGRQFAVPPHPSEIGQHPHYLHQQQQQRQPPSLSLPSKLYFPHVPRPHPHGPPGRIVAQPPTSPISQAPNGSAGGERKLPSLSAMLSPTSAPTAAAPAPPPAQHYSQPQMHAPIPVPVSHEAMFSHSPFSPPPVHAALPSPAPSAAAAAPPPSFPSGPNRSLFSPEPSATSFERLRISGGPLSPPPPSSSTVGTPFSPLSSSAHSHSTAATTPSANGGVGGDVDILDVAVETMAYRPSGRHLPARQVLPPLRSVLGDTALNAKRPNKGGHSEADKALLAPILPSATPSSTPNGGPPRLAPISTFAPLTAPSPPSAHATIPVSPASATPTPSHPPANANANPNLRASTWSAHSHATTATRSTADFDFAHPPSGSWRDRERERGSVGGWAVSVSGPGVTRERGGSTATSARTSVSSEPGK
ncbi:hypothetical protein JCM6882_001958 [Rhodosporidiobolus microsporus]